MRINLNFLILQNSKRCVNLPAIVDVHMDMFVVQDYANVLMDFDRMKRIKHVWVVCILIMDQHAFSFLFLHLLFCNDFACYYYFMQAD